jgi:hypothetical protein
MPISQWLFSPVFVALMRLVIIAQPTLEPPFIPLQEPKMGETRDAPKVGGAVGCLLIKSMLTRLDGAIELPRIIQRKYLHAADDQLP